MSLIGENLRQGRGGVKERFFILFFVIVYRLFQGTDKGK
jgi:hypothetical protein